MQKSNIKKLRTCDNGHQYHKSSDCPTCPICEEAKRPEDGFLALLSAPARRAIANAGINTLRQLSKYSEKDILALHGIGKSTIPILKRELKIAGLGFSE